MWYKPHTINTFAIIHPIFRACILFNRVLKYLFSKFGLGLVEPGHGSMIIFFRVDPINVLSDKLFFVSYTILVLLEYN